MQNLITQMAVLI